MKKKKTKVDKASNLINFIKVLGFLLPMVIYMIMTVQVFPSPNSAFLCLGYLVCFFPDGICPESSRQEIQQILDLQTDEGIPELLVVRIHS